MATPASSGIGRRRSFKQQASVEEQALSHIAEEAEAKNASNRLARTEARSVRSRELERQRREEEDRENQHHRDGQREHNSVTSSKVISPTSSYSSLASEDLSSDAIRSLKKELHDLEEKCRQAVIQTALLDSEKLMYRYEAELHKEEAEDGREQIRTIEHKNREQASELSRLRRSLEEQTKQSEVLGETLRRTNELIREHGLIVFADNVDVGSGSSNENSDDTLPMALLSSDRAQLLNMYSGSLDERLRKLMADKTAAEKQVLTLSKELEGAREQNSAGDRIHSPMTVNGTALDADVSVDVQKQLNEYRFKAKKSEQEITTLEGTASRLESQVRRFKAAAEDAETLVEDLKLEKRKLQRELREAQIQIEDLTDQTNNLKNRMEKLKKEKGSMAVSSK